MPICVATFAFLDPNGFLKFLVLLLAAWLAYYAVMILLGLLVLATQTGPFSQMVGVLRLENAIALFELGSHGHELAIQIAQTALLLVTLLMFQWYLRALPRPDTAKASATEGMF